MIVERISDELIVNECIRNAFVVSNKIIIFSIYPIL